MVGHDIQTLQAKVQNFETTLEVQMAVNRVTVNQVTANKGTFKTQRTIKFASSNF